MIDAPQGGQTLIPLPLVDGRLSLCTQGCTFALVRNMRLLRPGIPHLLQLVGIQLLPNMGSQIRSTSAERSHLPLHLLPHFSITLLRREPSLCSGLPSLEGCHKFTDAGPTISGALHDVHDQSQITSALIPYSNILQYLLELVILQTGLTLFRAEGCKGLRDAAVLRDAGQAEVLQGRGGGEEPHAVLELRRCQLAVAVHVHEIKECFRVLLGKLHLSEHFLVLLGSAAVIFGLRAGSNQVLEQVLRLLRTEARMLRDPGRPPGFFGSHPAVAVAARGVLDHDGMPLIERPFPGGCDLHSRWWRRLQLHLINFDVVLVALIEQPSHTSETLANFATNLIQIEVWL
mmetsp:Transcript_18733/g.26332  ORF Transcript_18733/g.26332 Transcript_18733/m.26332 type:complete len:345 (-) Transcript_18733:499-1533(-)